MAAALIVLAIAALIIVAAALWPLLRDRTDVVGADRFQDERHRVQEDLERSLTAIGEIEHDHAAGNLSDDDYRELDAAERARAIALIRERDGSETGHDGS